MNTSQSTRALDDYPMDTIPDTPLWSENFAYSCNNSASEIGMMVFLGRWWADPTVWREVISIGLPNDRVICIKNYGRAATNEIASGAMFRHEPIKPGQTIRLTYDGPAFEQDRTALLRHGFVPQKANRCQIDIVFEGKTPVWDMSGHAGKSAQLAGALHIEQLGIGTGYINFGNERFAINDAFMSRDHSRGIRNVGKHKRHSWLQGYFSADEMGFNVYVMELYDVEGWAMANASISKGNRRYPAVVKEIDLIRGCADAAKPFGIVLESEFGAMPIVAARTFVSMPLSFVSPFDFHHGSAQAAPFGRIFEEAIEWDWKGKRGLGWSERTFTHDPFYLYE